MPNQTEDTLSRITFLILFLLTIVLSYFMVASFLVAITIGALIAFTLTPLKERITSRTIRPWIAVAIIFSILTLVIIVPLALFVFSAIHEATRLTQYLSLHEISYQSIIENIGQWPITSYFIKDPASLDLKIRTQLGALGTYVSAFVLRQATQIPKMFIQTIFILLSCLFFLLDGDQFKKFMSDKIPLNKNIMLSLRKAFNENSKSAIWATLIAAVAQSLTILLGFVILNVPAAFLASGTTFVFSVIPYVGPAPAWIAGAFYLYLKGFQIKMIFMIVFGLAAGLADNVARTLVLMKKGHTRGLHPLIGLIAVIGGLQVFGFFGVILGPVIAALLIAMCDVWPTLWER